MLKLRPRRLRLNENLRSMIRETNVSVKDLIYPLFVVAGSNVREEIPSMPDCFHLSVDNAVELAKRIAALGIPAVEVFGLPEYKDDIGSSTRRARIGYRRRRLPLPIHDARALRQALRSLRRQ